jgi:hypothetical protein
LTEDLTFQIKVDRGKRDSGERYIKLYVTVPGTASQNDIAEKIAQRVIIYSEKHSEDMPIGKKMTFGQYDLVKQRRIKCGIAGELCRTEESIDIRFTSRGTLYR